MGDSMVSTKGYWGECIALRLHTDEVVKEMEKKNDDLEK